MVLSIYRGIDTKTIAAFAGCDDNGSPIYAVLSPSYFSRDIIDVNNDFYYRFEIDEEIDELSDLEGCSGAPIFHSKGELISLICGGWEKSKSVYVLNFKKIIDLVYIVQGFPTQP